MTDECESAGESVYGANAETKGVDPDVGASSATAPAPRKKSAAKILKEYYARRAIMYKEMYEHGSTSR